MLKIDRRKFISIAGTAPLGLVVSSYAGIKSFPQENKITSGSQITSNDLFDPWLEIDTKNIVWNLSQVRKRVNNRPIMAVIKCNAYGHGLVEFARILSQNNIKYFAVVNMQEAQSLRDNGITGSILNFGPFSKSNAENIVKQNISQSVFSEEVYKLVDAARKAKKQVKVHIKIDSGLGRVGVPYYAAMPFIEKLASTPEIFIEGIFTTLTEEIDYDKVQLERFLEICNQANKKGISVGIRHVASSLAVAKYPDSFLDMVRPGNCLYGIEPLPNMDLKQVMSMKTKIIYVKKMLPGETVGYHKKYKIEKETLLATLPLGYSDGYPYRGVDKAEVLINGKYWPMVAYMSANHVFADITGSGSNKIKTGDEVVLFGNQGNEKISIADVSEWGESSVYKTVILMNPLLPRLYV